MKKTKLVKLLFAIAAFFLSQQLFSQVNSIVSMQKISDYAPVNGLKTYYKIYGEGKTLLLLHGAYMTIDIQKGIKRIV